MYDHIIGYEIDKAMRLESIRLDNKKRYLKYQRSIDFGHKFGMDHICDLCGMGIRGYHAVHPNERVECPCL